jgi:hypothetical protein
VQKPNKRNQYQAKPVKKEVMFMCRNSIINKRNQCQTPKSLYKVEEMYYE